MTLRPGHLLVTCTANEYGGIAEYNAANIGKRQIQKNSKNMKKGLHKTRAAPCQRVIAELESGADALLYPTDREISADRALGPRLSKKTRCLCPQHVIDVELVAFAAR